MTKIEQKEVKISLQGDQLGKRAKWLSQIHAWSLILLPLLGSIVAAVLFIERGISNLDLLMLVMFYFLTSMGITIGYHRYFAHSAFQAGPIVKLILGGLGSMSAQGPVTYWVSNHRRHHRFSDKSGDPHSPYFRGEEELSCLGGLWHAHCGWIFNPELTNSFLFSNDLLKDPLTAKINRLYFFWVFAGLALPAIIGGSLSGTWIGAFTAFIWGGLVRIFIVSHLSYSINSICHFFGKRPFETQENSTNNVWLALPTGGEAWHNNHHAFPSSANFGLMKGQIDIGYGFIRLLQLFGLANEIKVPEQERIKARQLSQSIEN